jgi:putative acetyltransferase
MTQETPLHFQVRLYQGANELALARHVLAQYGDSLSVDLSFQHFEDELISLPGEYAQPNGGLLLAFVNGVVTGCCAFRPLHDVDYPNACEMRRLFVIKSSLIEQCMVEARAAGYMHMLLDVLQDFEVARHLYGSAGFVEVPPFYLSPLAGSQFLMAHL